MRHVQGKIGWVAWVAVAFASLSTSVQAAPSKEQPKADSSSYPYDPSCPWGRIADGRGMLIRCLSQGEAKALASGARIGAAEPKAAEAKVAQPPAAAPPKPAEPEASTDSPAATPNEPATSDLTEPGDGADNLGPTPELSVDVDKVVADKGQFPGSKLGAASAKERYLGCLDRNGGLAKDQGEVVVRFLVRERGRAEGVSVQSYKGVSKLAAACVADVVDRRAVGTPEGPMVGASVRISFSMKVPTERPAKK